LSFDEIFRRARHPLNSAALILGLGLGGAAHGQEDPIGALLDKAAPAPQAQPPAATPPPQAGPPIPAPAPTPAEAPPNPRDAAPPPGPPPQSEVTRPAEPPRYAPMPVRPPPSAPGAPRDRGLSEPTRIEETGKAPDGPPSPSDLYFESRVRSSFAAAQGMQGPLDGRWVVRAGGAEVFDLQLVDKNQGAVEGAWRDPRRKGAADASGFIDSIQRSGGELMVRFQPRPGDDPVQLSLRPSGDGWAGELVERGERKAVTVRRN
jgi:hypothetical protein